jgi:hypothetical protein
MIRPFTLITLLLAAGSGAYLFAVKHHAQMLDDQIAEISQESRLDAQRIRVLQAQWALETDPTRLQQLAAQFTALQPMQPAQLVTVAALRSSLPVPGTAAPSGNPELGQMLPGLDGAAPDAPQPDAVQLAATQALVFVGGLPLPPPPAPVSPRVVVASAAGPAAGAPTPLRRKRRASHALQAGTELAEASPPPADHGFAAPDGAIFRAVPISAQVVPARAVLPPAPQTAADESGSVLGMAANLPPPQPPAPGLNN